MTRTGPASDRPTLKTIAERTGLALTTVSRALRNGADIAESTKERVRQVASELGYLPNRAGVRLRTGRTQVIALVMSTEEDAMLRTAQQFASVAAALRRTAYQLVITPYFPSEDLMDPIRDIVETGSADGMIINQTRPDDPRVRFLADVGFPFASHGRTDMGVAHAYVDYDIAAFIEASVQALRQRGRARMLLIPPPDKFTYGGLMTAAFRACCDRLGIAGEIADGFDGYASDARIEAGVARRMAAPLPPDAIVAGTTNAALAAIAGIEAAGFLLGQDVDLAGREPVRLLTRLRPQIIATRDDAALTGTLLAQAVIAAIENPSDAPLQTLVRGSVGGQ